MYNSFTFLLWGTLIRLYIKTLRWRRYTRLWISLHTSAFILHFKRSKIQKSCTRLSSPNSCIKSPLEFIDCTLSLEPGFWVEFKTIVFYFVRSEIGDIAGVAEVTIRHSYRLLIGKAAELFPPDFTFHTPIERLPTSWFLFPITPCPIPNERRCYKHLLW